MKIIIDSLVPNHRKKQLMPDSTMEPPAGRNRTHLLHCRHTPDSFIAPEKTVDTTRAEPHQKTSNILFKERLQFIKTEQTARAGPPRPERRLRHTQHAEAPDFVHEEGRDNVSWQYSQCSQEVDKIDPVGTVIIVKCHLTACLVVVEEAVDHP